MSVGDVNGVCVFAIKSDQKKKFFSFLSCTEAAAAAHQSTELSANSLSLKRSGQGNALCVFVYSLKKDENPTTHSPKQCKSHKTEKSNKSVSIKDEPSSSSSSCSIPAEKW